MSRLAPPPGSPAPNQEFGNPVPAAGVSGSVMPAPAQPPSPGAMKDVTNIMSIVNATRAIAEDHPQAVPIAQQINDLVQQLQMVIVQAMPPTEVPAPPV